MNACGIGYKKMVKLTYFQCHNLKLCHLLWLKIHNIMWKKNNKEDDK